MSKKSKEKSWPSDGVVSGEPWVDLPDGKALADWDHQAEIEYNQQHRQLEKHRFFARIFDYLNDNGISGGYHEFGCHRVRTFRMALTEARRHGMSDRLFYGYDSFEGLPPATSDPARDLWRQAGVLTTSEDEFRKIICEHGLYVDQARTIKGFYNKSLTTERQNQILAESGPAALIVVDCDLYESAVSVFDYIDPFLQEGTALYIDDLFVGYRGTPTKGGGTRFSRIPSAEPFQLLPPSRCWMVGPVIYRLYRRSHGAEGRSLIKDFAHETGEPHSI